VLAVEINFLRQVYAASGVDGNPEEVVHPTRLFAALVQACCANDLRQHRSVVERLERAAPPEIRMGETFNDPRYNNENDTEYYVPTHVNSKKLRAKIPRKAGDFFPWGETRDVMRRPVIRLKEPRCVLVWPDVGLSESEAKAMDDLLAGVVYIGRTESLASLRRVDQPDFTGLTGCFVPDAVHGDTPIRVPRPGLFEEMDQAYLRCSPTGERGHVNHWPTATYRRVSATPDHQPIWTEMLRFRLHGPPVHATRALRLIEAFRSKVLSLERGATVPPVLSGHGWDGPSHVAFLPLVFAGFEHANGFVKGVGVCLPRSITSADRASVRDVLADLCATGFYFGKADYGLELLGSDEAVLRTLQEDRWCRASRRWATVTPVVLDVPPKKNRSVAQLIQRACSYVEAPEPARFEWRNAGFQGSSIPHKEQFEVSRKGCSPLSGQVGHLHLEFEQPVRGPLALGCLRHFGMGLMLPE